MTHSTDTKAIFKGALDAVGRRDLAGYLSYLADDAVFEFPFAPGDRPRSLRGREEITAYMSGLAGVMTGWELRSMSILGTEDPNTIVVEFTTRGARTNDPVVKDSSFIGLVTTRDGLITRWRDYWNPLGGRPVNDAA